MASLSLTSVMEIELDLPWNKKRGEGGGGGGGGGGVEGGEEEQHHCRIHYSIRWVLVGRSSDASYTPYFA